MKLLNNCVDMFKTNCFYTDGYQFLNLHSSWCDHLFCKSLKNFMKISQVKHHYKEFVLRENQTTRFSAKINSKHNLFSLKFQYNLSFFISVKHHKMFVNSSFYKNHKFVRQMKSFLMLTILISDKRIESVNYCSRISIYVTDLDQCTMFIAAFLYVIKD